ncbi:TlpA family protein disulfide reductase [Haloferula sp. A504]|uniref:TlpA family protein disulfide reductase n=1 Tax=Haloferula sp. A504 TaxID=3373601 RepID=UPI0031C00844|nr:TlpA family protein disulfide reductase [Verrucomicrobiaceae bacterium E54]
MKWPGPIAAAVLATSLIASAEPETGSTPLDEAVETMLSVRESDARLEEAIADARKLGAGTQAVIEARFLYHVDRREDAQLAAMLPAMLEQADRFRIEESRIFAFEEDWLAVVEYVKAIAALEKGDRAGFKKHITEAFWLSPRQGAAFAPHIERVRLTEAMKRIRVDFELGLTDLNGRPASLGQLRGESKAVLLHFFSPWSRECEEGLDDLRSVAGELGKHGIPVIGIVGEGGAEAVAETSDLLATLKEPAPGAWLVDHPENPLARLLRIQSAPTMILVDKSGRVLFNGHPSDEQLWKDLSEIAPGCKRPARRNAGH